MTFRLTGAALQDVANIVDYTLEHFPNKSNAVSLELQQYFETIALNPAIGRPGPRDKTRELPMRSYPFVIIFRLVADQVEILRVYHTARDPETKLG